MKYSVAVMLLLGAISQTEAVQLNQMNSLYINNAPAANTTTVAAAQIKAQEAAKKAEDSKKKVEALKAQRVQTSKPTQQTL